MVQYAYGTFWARSRALIRRQKPDGPGVERVLEVIERNAKLQTRIIEDLLDVSRIISGSLGLEIPPVELAPLVEAAVANAGPAAKAKGLRLDLVLHPSATAIDGDPGRLQQIVSNLLVNAVKFTPAGGRIEARLEGRGPQVQIVVRDTGLAIAQHLVALHNGSIAVASGRGRQRAGGARGSRALETGCAGE